MKPYRSGPDPEPRYTTGRRLSHGAEYIEKKIPSALPIYIAAGVFLAGALILPVYSLWGLIVTAALSGAAYIVASKKIPPRVVKVTAPSARTKRVWRTRTRFCATSPPG